MFSNCFVKVFHSSKTKNDAKKLVKVTYVDEEAANEYVVFA